MTILETTNLHSGRLSTMVRISLLSLALFLVSFASPAMAQTITTTQVLSFGTIAIDNLNDNVRLNIRNNGGCNPNGNTFVIDPCSRGEFLLTGGPANSVYTVTTPATINLTGPGPNVFFVDNFRVRPNTLITNASGTDTFRIMARLNSTLGQNFGDGTFNDTFNITVNF